MATKFTPVFEMTDPHIAIPLPWKGDYYCINLDEMRHGRQWFMVAWKRQFGSLFIRAGWATRFDHNVAAAHYGSP